MKDQRAGVTALKTADNPKQRRLATARSTKHRNKFAGTDL
jgi:hypothetical protein